MTRPRAASIPPGLRVRCARAEIVFRERDDDGDWLVWVMVQGEGGASIADSPFEIDRDHAAFAARVKHPNQPEAEPQLLLLAEPVRDAVLRWAIPGG